MAKQTTAQENEKRNRFLVQAPVSPLDQDGIVASAVGTVVFGSLVLVQLMLKSGMDARGDGWWLWVGIAGFAIGLIGTSYCLWRKLHR